MTENPRPVHWPSAARGSNELTVAIGDDEYQIGPASTADVLDALATRQVSAIIPGLMPEPDADALVAALEAPRSRLSIALLTRVAHGVVAELGQMPWWSVYTLAAAAGDNWTVLDGRMTARGVDLLGLPLHRMLAAVYVILAEGLDEEQLAGLRRTVWEPPPDADIDGVVPWRSGPRAPQWTPEEQHASFQAFAAMAGGFGG